MINQTDEISRLKKKLTCPIRTYTEDAQEVFRLRAENDRLRAAIKPFADIAEIVIKMERKALGYGSKKYYFWYSEQQMDDKPLYLTADDFRNAQKAMKEKVKK